MNWSGNWNKIIGAGIGAGMGAGIGIERFLKELERELEKRNWKKKELERELNQKELQGIGAELELNERNWPQPCLAADCSATVMTRRTCVTAWTLRSLHSAHWAICGPTAASPEQPSWSCTGYPCAPPRRIAARPGPSPARLFAGLMALRAVQWINVLKKLAWKPFIFGPSSINHFPYKINFSFELSLKNCAH